MTPPKPIEVQIESDPARGLAAAVGGLLLRPASAKALLALAHGAGAGMRHAFMDAICARLADRSVATLRYEFPYMAAGRRAPDRAPKLVPCVRAALAEAQRQADGLPLFAGGKSMGGRMTSLALSEEAMPALRGVVFFGFPLHPAGKPGSERAAHLADVATPMLFLQGTRDKLADLELLEPVVGALGKRAELCVIDGADHSFHVLKRSGRSDEEVLDELADRAAAFVGEHLG